MLGEMLQAQIRSSFMSILAVLVRHKSFMPLDATIKGISLGLGLMGQL